MTLSRRSFVRLLGAGVVALARPARAATPAALRLALVGGAPDDPAVRGVRLGLEEAARAAALFGAAPPALAQGADATVLLRDARPHVLLGGWEDADAAQLAALAAAHDALFANLAAPADALRTGGAAWHVAPSARMLAAAPNGERAVAWHPSLEAFGAAQLNDRFQARFGAPMDGAAWCGWMAVKLLAESALRAGAPDARALAARLAAPNARFDGHKGRPLTFDAATHQLRQPLYRVVGDGARELPQP